MWHRLSTFQHYMAYLNVSTLYKSIKTTKTEKRRIKDKPPTEHTEQTIYQPDTLTSKLVMKRARVLWRRALKKANNPDADLSDSGSFRLGELARIARRQQLEQEELDQT